MNNRPSTRVGHSQRLQRLCVELKTSTPTWIEHVVRCRNDTMHEAIFFDEPLGFAVFGGNTSRAHPSGNIILELQLLASRFVCAILSLPCPDYISSPLNTGQIYGVSIWAAKNQLYPRSSPATAKS